MKKFCLTVLIATVFLLGANAQTIIKNDYSTSESSATVEVKKDNKEETIGAFNLVYYGFDGLSNYGVSDYWLKPNGFAGEFGFRIDFKDFYNYSFDIGPNYTFKVWGKDKNKVLLTAAVGPSFCGRDVAKIKYDSQGNPKVETETKFKFDMFANVRLSFKVSRVLLSAGYFMWAPEFKMGGKYRADGFNVAIGYDLW